MSAGRGGDKALARGDARQQLALDDGFSFGIGAFETIAFYGRRPVLLDAHLCRLRAALEALGISPERCPSVRDVLREVAQQALDDGVAKVMVSETNVVWQFRENHYTEQQRRDGLRLVFGSLTRNETSPLVRHKTLACAESILERRRVQTLGFDDSLLLNSKGEVCETTSSNVFLVTSTGRIKTPALCCGLLPGTLRTWVIGRRLAEECRLSAEDLLEASALFVTNAVMGVMPVASLESQLYASNRTVDALSREYRVYIDTL
ncbi:MAG: aminotransferase class IV [Coriobacteriales bacterium]|jgi:4-amino-4-deoxychorismate lyase|nr:aminotransferase class IV [Coriobacteriales bacterium]